MPRLVLRCVSCCATLSLVLLIPSYPIASHRILGRPVSGLENLMLSQIFSTLAGAYAMWLEYYSKTQAPSVHDEFGDLGKYANSVQFTVWPLALQFPASVMYGVTEVRL